MVRRQLVVDIAFGVTEDALFEFLAATPVPLPPDQSVPIVPFDDVRVLSDGRVAVVGSGELSRGDVRIFVKEGRPLVARRLVRSDFERHARGQHADHRTDTRRLTEQHP